MSTVTILSRTLAVDGDGQPIRDAQGNDTYTPTSTDVAGATTWPRASTENVQDEDLVIDGLNLLLPPGVTIGALDQVVVNDLTYDVDGAPGAWTNGLTGWNAGTQVALIRTTG